MLRRLLTLDEAQQVFRKHFEPKPLSVEEIRLLEAHNRVLAEDVISTLDIPPFDRSTVDGYAVNAKDTSGADENKSVELRIRGVANAGEMPEFGVAHGDAVEIVTGAPIPKGANAVVMLEYAERKDGFVYVFNPVAEDENIMKAGTDIRRGETVLKTGQLLGSREIGVLAAVGLARVKVYVVPRIAVLSTGAEVTEPGRPLIPGRLYDINAYSLSAAVLESCGHPFYLGVFSDDRTELRKALKKALSSADMVITSGGVSVGPKDVMPQTVDSLGKPGVILSGIAIKPGKPATVAIVGKKPVFSLPGHPTSALLVFHLLVSPVIRAMAGREARKNPKVKALASMRMFAAKGRRTFITVRLRRDSLNQLIAEPVPTGHSGAITTLSKADGFVELAENEQFIDAKEEVIVHLFRDLEQSDF